MITHQGRQHVLQTCVEGVAKIHIRDINGDCLQALFPIIDMGFCSFFKLPRAKCLQAGQFLRHHAVRLNRRIEAQGPLLGGFQYQVKLHDAIDPSRFVLGGWSTLNLPGARRFRRIADSTANLVRYLVNAEERNVSFGKPKTLLVFTDSEIGDRSAGRAQ